MLIDQQRGQTGGHFVQLGLVSICLPSCCGRAGRFHPYDVNILGIRPDFVVEMRADILTEVDGPMLRCGLHAMHGAQIALPRSLPDRPDPDRLAERYVGFQDAA